VTGVSFATLLRLEWRILNATSVPWLVAAILILTFAAALVNGSLERRSFEETRGGEETPGGQSATNFRAALPPLPTAVLSTGDSDILPQRYAWRTGERFSPFVRTFGTRILGGFFPERPTENPSLLAMGRVDVGFVVVYFYPLLILALTYNIVSDDRDAGVLALVVAQPISFRRWLLARVTVRGGFLICFPVAVSIAMTVAGIRDSWATIAMWALALLAYATFWIALGVMVSLRSGSSATAASMAVSGWLVLVIIIPALVNLAVPLIAPSTTTVSFVNAERAASLDINPRIDAARRALGRGKSQLADELTNTRRRMFEQRLAPVLRDLESGEKRLDNAMAVAQFLSPALLFQSVTDEVAGTDRARHREFLSQLDQHIRTLDRENNRRPFMFREEPTFALQGRAAVRILAMLVMAGVLLLVISGHR
jgi:ABC-2 type transport system permease protein